MIQIYQAKIDDVAALSELFDLYRIFYGKESNLIGANQFLTERIIKNETTIFLAKDIDHGQLVGFTQLYPLFSSTRMQRLLLLNDLFVLEEFRGRGISKLLIERSKQLALEINAAGILLETQKSNLIGNALYPRMNFHLEDDVNFYFWNSMNT